MTDSDKIKAIVERAKEINRLIESGYAGTLSTGKIVDRREYPEAIPIQTNSLLGVPEPRKLKPITTAAPVEGER